MQRLAQYAGYLAVRTIIAVAQALPVWACHWAAGALATLFWRVLRIRHKVIHENLAHAFPEMTTAQRDRLAWRMWEHLFLFAAEIAHTGRKIHETNWRQYARLANEKELIALALEDRPLLLVTAHYGNFEMATYLLSLIGYEIYSVARPLDNPYLDRFVNTFRGSTGQRMLSKQADYERMLDILSAGGTVSFVADQYAGRKGCWVEFFNRPASAHKVIALFAVNHDAPIGVGSCRRLSRPLNYELKLDAVADPRHLEQGAGALRELTQWYTGQMEAFIRQAPEQYWWLHRRWKDHRKKRAKPAKAA